MPLADVPGLLGVANPGPAGRGKGGATYGPLSCGSSSSSLSLRVRSITSIFFLSGVPGGDEPTEMAVRLGAPSGASSSESRRTVASAPPCSAARPLPFEVADAPFEICFETAVPCLSSEERQVPSGSTVTESIDEGHVLRMSSK